MCDFRTIGYCGQGRSERGICQRAERGPGSALVRTCRHHGPALIQAMLRP